MYALKYSMNNSTILQQCSQIQNQLAYNNASAIRIKNFLPQWLKNILVRCRGNYYLCLKKISAQRLFNLCHHLKQENNFKLLFFTIKSGFLNCSNYLSMASNELCFQSMICKVMITKRFIALATLPIIYGTFRRI